MDNRRDIRLMSSLKDLKLDTPKVPDTIDEEVHCFLCREEEKPKSSVPLRDLTMIRRFMRTLPSKPRVKTKWIRN